jgi:hypothetical protein
MLEVCKAVWQAVRHVGRQVGSQPFSMKEGRQAGSLALWQVGSLAVRQAGIHADSHVDNMACRQGNHLRCTSSGKEAA